MSKRNFSDPAGHAKHSDILQAGTETISDHEQSVSAKDMGACLRIQTVELHHLPDSLSRNGFVHIISRLPCT